MTNKQYFVLTCTKNHTWNEPVPDTKLAPGEHRSCPKCGGSSWIAADAPRITIEEKITISQKWVSDVTSNTIGEDIYVIGAGRNVGKPKIGLINVTMSPEVEKELKNLGINAKSEIEDAIASLETSSPSPESIKQTKKIPIPADLNPTRKLLVEDVTPGGAGDPVDIQQVEDFPSGE